jgi:hypothetical protein
MAIVIPTTGVEKKDSMKTCCLCGEAILLGDYFISITQRRSVVNAYAEIMDVQVPLEDGSFTKHAHSVCPALYGAPMALVGANGEKNDI